MLRKESRSGSVEAAHRRLASAKLTKFTAALISVISVILFLIASVHAPIEIHGDASFDDALYLALGRHIADGEWLGPYNQYTLIKGVGYPLFLAANAWLGLPVSFSHAIFHCVAIGLLFWVIARLSAMPYLATCGFIITVWAPAPYLIRFARNAIYPGQTLIFFGVVAYALCADLPKNRRIVWALLAGVLGGWFALTREEGVWILPGIAIIVVYASYVARRNRTVTWDVMVPLTSMLLVFMATLGSVSYANRMAYGTKTRVEITSSPFKDALAALESVEVGGRLPYVPVSRQARLAIYAASPAFHSLKDYFDGPSGASWQVGCAYYPTSCGDIAGGWFMWALREAVATRGHYSSPRAAASFYRTLTKEIKQACSDGRLKCSTTLYALLPHISRSQWARLPASLLSGVKQISFVEAPRIDAGPSSGYPYVMTADEVFLGHPVRTSGPQDTHVYQITGWYRSSSKNDWIAGQLTPTNEQPLDTAIRRIASPDLVTMLGDRSALYQRFDFNVACGAPCNFKFINGDGAAVAFNFDQLVGQRQSYPLGSATLHIDTITLNTDEPRDSVIRSKVSMDLRSFGTSVFVTLMPWFAASGVAAMLLVICIGVLTRRVGIVEVMAAATWTLLASRLLLLGLIDISSFPGMNSDYLAPAYLLMCVAVALSFGALHASATRIHKIGDQPKNVRA